MSFTVVPTNQNQYFCVNDQTNEHFTVNTPDEVTAAIVAYNQGVTDKAQAIADAEVAATVANAAPVVPAAPTYAEAATATPAPVTNVN